MEKEMLNQILRMRPTKFSGLGMHRSAQPKILTDIFRPNKHTSWKWVGQFYLHMNTNNPVHLSCECRLPGNSAYSCVTCSEMRRLEFFSLKQKNINHSNDGGIYMPAKSFSWCLLCSQQEDFLKVESWERNFHKNTIINGSEVQQSANNLLDECSFIKHISYVQPLVERYFVKIIEKKNTCDQMNIKYVPCVDPKC